MNPSEAESTNCVRSIYSVLNSNPAKGKRMAEILFVGAHCKADAVFTVYPNEEGQNRSADGDSFGSLLNE